LGDLPAADTFLECWYSVLPSLLDKGDTEYYHDPMHTTLLPLRSFVQTTVFTKTAEAVGLGDDQLLSLEAVLRENPEAGATVGGTGGARKIRVALPGGGKRGGARVMYYYVGQDDTIYFLLAYGKNVQDDLAEEQKKALKSIVAAL
jgi:hypothetical protein